MPPLGESDPVVRLLVQSISTHPRVLAWLATDGLIRNFTVVVGNIADGRTPARHLRDAQANRPVQDRRGAEWLDDRSRQLRAI